jgi:hypothetical protein
MANDGGDLDRTCLHRIEVPEGGLSVFRFVHCKDPGDEKLKADFESDAARGKKPLGRSARIPELRDGMSVFRSLDLARARWRNIAHRARRGNPKAEIKIGSYIARVDLRPDIGIMYEDLGDPDGHMTLWGPPVTLAAAVAEIVPAEE